MNGDVNHPRQVLLIDSRSDLIEIQKIEEEEDVVINYLVVYHRTWSIKYCME